MKTIKVSIGAVMEGTFTLGPGTYHVEQIEGELWITVDVEDNVPTFAEAAAFPPIKVFDYALVKEKKLKRTAMPSFWRRFSAALPPPRWTAPELSPRRTGRRSRDGRWFRGVRQTPLVGAA